MPGRIVARGLNHRLNLRVGEYYHRGSLQRWVWNALGWAAHQPTGLNRVAEEGLQRCDLPPKGRGAVVPHCSEPANVLGDLARGEVGKRNVAEVLQQAVKSSSVLRTVWVARPASAR